MKTKITSPLELFQKLQDDGVEVYWQDKKIKHKFTCCVVSKKKQFADDVYVKIIVMDEKE